MSHIHDIIKADVVGAAQLRVTFDDGEVRELDLSDKLRGEVFEPLRDPTVFAQVQVDLGALEWPTGAGLDPIVIYECLPPLNATRVTRAA